MAVLTEFVQDGIRYVPTKAIAQTVGLSPRYLADFCRDGHVMAVFHKGVWYATEASVQKFLAEQARQRQAYNRKLSEEKKREVQELRAAQAVAFKSTPAVHARRSGPRKVGRTLATTFATFTLLIGVGAAFEMLAPPNSVARASLKSNIASARENISDALAGNISAAHQQLAAVSSLPWLDTFAATLYRTVCPIFRDCPREDAIAQQPVQPTARRVVSVATSSPATPARVAPPQTVQQTVVNQPVIERVRETVRTVIEDGINAAYVDERMAALQNSLQQQIASVASNANAQSTTIYQTLGAVARIENLDAVNITNSTVTGGSIEGASITGTLSNTISSALATITSLTATELVATNATTTSLFVAATTTSNGLKVASLDCSSLGNGGTLTTDANGNVVCAADDGGSGSGGSDAFTHPFAGASATTSLVIFGGAASSTLFSSLDTIYVGRTATTTIRGDGVASTLPFASTTMITATTASSTSLVISNLAGCSEALETNSLGQVICGTDATATGAANDFSFAQSYGVLAAATSSTIWAQSGIFASSTSHFVAFDASTATITNATTTNLYASNELKIGSLSGILKATSGVVSAATPGVDYANFGYLFPSNATTTLLAFTGGLTTTSATAANLFSSTVLGSVAKFGATASTTIDTGGNVAVAGTLGVTGHTTLANASTTNLSATYASSTQGFFGSVSIGSLSGFLKATAGSIATALVDLASNVTGILGVANGGTGWGNVASGAVVLGNGTGSLATTSAGTDGQVLALVSGVPSWVATTTLSTINGTLGVASGGTGLTSYTQGHVLYASGTGTLAGTTTANLKSTLALNNVENTALSTWAGSSNLTTLGTIGSGVWNGTTIAIANGGTGTTTAPVGHLLYGGASAYQSVATSSASCSSGILCSSFTVVGSMSPSITFSAPAGTALSIPYASSTALTVSATAYFPGSGIWNSSGNLGIGTTSPPAMLTVANGYSGSALDGNEVFQIGKSGSGYATFRDGTRTLIWGTASADTVPFIGSFSNHNFGIVTNNTPRMTIDTSGNIVMAATNSSGGNSNLCWDGSGSSTWGTCTSLRAFKTNVTNLSPGLDTLLELRPVEFDWKASGMHDLGFIAEEVVGVHPLLAEYAGKDGALSGVKYNSMSALIVKAVQDIASLGTTFKANLIAWLADAQNGITDFFARRVHTQELCVDDICVTRDQFAEVFGSPQSAAAAGTPSAGLPQGAPAALPEAAASATSGPAILTANGDNPATASSTPANDNEPAVAEDVQNASEPQAPDALLVEMPGSAEPAPEPPAPQVDLGVDAPPDPANDNPPPAEFPATGTE